MPLVKANALCAFVRFVTPVFLIAGVSVGCHGRAFKEVSSAGGHFVSESFIIPSTQIAFDERQELLTDEEFRRLFPYLRQLRPYLLGLEDAAITDASIPLIRKLPTLMKLYVDGTRVTPEGLKQLRGMRNLKYIWVSADAFSENEIATLESQLPGVEIERRHKRRGDWYTGKELRFLFNEQPNQSPSTTAFSGQHK